VNSEILIAAKVLDPHQSICFNNNIITEGFTKIARFNYAAMKALLTPELIFCGLLTVVVSVSAQTWTPSTNAPGGVWWTVASSADGTKLVAAINHGGIFTSTNSGLTWVSNNVPARFWYSVASSADGTRLFAAINTLSTSGTGGIYMSTNGGSTWTPTTAPAYLQAWNSIACSTNGAKIVAAGTYEGASNQIYISTNSGNSWTPTKAPNLPSPEWYAVACSGDGTKLAAVVNEANAVYTSTNSGANWTSNYISDSFCYAVASSADGSKLVAASSGAAANGLIYTSTNSGVSWFTNNVPPQSWQSVASSWDGNKIIGAGYGLSSGAIYSSTDGGKNWISNNVPATGIAWASVASSADGNKLVAVAKTGQVYTGVQAPAFLNLTLSGTNAILSWSSTLAGFQLQQNSSLTSAGWISVTNPVSATNGQNEVIVSVSNGPSFYRLGSQ
jgi:photosystem II stability/assembly factor-like uncharacterized protein